MKVRSLGFGFGEGHERIVFSDEAMPLRATITDQGIVSLNDTSTALSKAFDKETISILVEDSLFEKEIPKLASVLPQVISSLTSSSRELLFSKENVQKLPAHLVKELQHAYGQKELGLENINFENVAKLDSKVMAYIVPELLVTLPEKTKHIVASEIIDLLPREFFSHYSDRKHFSSEFNDSDALINKVEHNGRTVKIFADTAAHNTVKYKGQEWQLDHTHIHPGLHVAENGALEREYNIYKNRDELQAVKDGYIPDPNKLTVAEVHTVFSRQTANNDETRYLVFGSLIRIGSYNDGFQKILKAAEGVSEGNSITPDKNILLNHMALYGEQFKTRAMPIYDSWSSTHLPQPAFQAGLTFALAPKPIEISLEQYRNLHKIIPELQPIDEVNVVKPIERMAHSRNDVSTNKNRQEEIVIIGAGIAGTLTALQLAKMKDDSGKALYKVTLLDARKDIMEGASAIAGRGNTHVTPGEYPVSTDNTPKDCMLGALYYAQMLGKRNYESAEGSKVFAVANNASDQLSGDDYAEYIQKQTMLYREHYEKLEEVYGSKTSSMFYGTPDRFIRTLAPRDYRHYLPDVSIAVKTQEKPFSMVRILNFLKNEIERTPNLHLVTGEKVENAFKQNNGTYRLTTESGKEYLANQVVNASWESSYGLDNMINPEAMKGTSFEVHARGMVMLDVSKLKTTPESIFLLLGKHGGMYHRISREVAYLYLPGSDGCYLGNNAGKGESLNSSQPELSLDMKEVLAMPKEARIKKAEQILQTQIEKFPFLKDAKVIDMLVRPTVIVGKENDPNTTSLENRSLYAPSQISNGWHTIIPSKLMYGPLVSVSVCTNVVEESKTSGKAYPANYPLQKGDELPTVLPEIFHLSAYQKDMVTNDMGNSRPELYTNTNIEYKGVIPHIVKPSEIDANLKGNYDKVLQFSQKLDGEAKFIYSWLKDRDESFVKRVVNNDSLHNMVSPFAIKHVLPLMQRMMYIGDQAVEAERSGLSAELIYENALNNINKLFGNSSVYGLSFSLTDSDFNVRAGQQMGLVKDVSKRHLRELNDEGFTPSLGHRRYADVISEQPGVSIQSDGVHKGSNSRVPYALPMAMSFWGDDGLSFSVVGALNAKEISKYLSQNINQEAGIFRRH